MCSHRRRHQTVNERSRGDIRMPMQGAVLRGREGDNSASKRMIPSAATGPRATTVLYGPVHTVSSEHLVSRSRGGVRVKPSSAGFCNLYICALARAGYATVRGGGMRVKSIRK